LNVQEDLVIQWVKDATRQGTLWTAKERKQLPKLLVVLEEWTCPSWTRISWDTKDKSPGPTAVGLLTTNAASAPIWRYLAMSEGIATSFRIGNTSVHTILITSPEGRKFKSGLFLLLELPWIRIPTVLDSDTYGFEQEFANSFRLSLSPSKGILADLDARIYGCGGEFINYSRVTMLPGIGIIIALTSGLGQESIKCSQELSVNRLRVN
jgi:hypothetical protein